MRNVHGKFVSGTILLNVGLVLASAVLLFRALIDADFGGELALLPPPVAFGISGTLCLLGLIFAKSEQHIFNFYRDGLPPLAFSTCLLVAGIRENVTWLLFIASVVTNLIFLFAAGKYDTYDEDQDRIPIYLRWLF